MLALPIFPGRRQPSIVGAGELNFCVRYGNRWNPFAITTENCIKFAWAEVSSACPQSLYIFYTLLSRPFLNFRNYLLARFASLACFAHLLSFHTHIACFLKCSVCLLARYLAYPRSAHFRLHCFPARLVIVIALLRSCAFRAARASSRPL